MRDKGKIRLQDKHGKSIGEIESNGELKLFGFREITDEEWKKVEHER